MNHLPTDQQLARQLAQMSPLPAAFDSAELMYRAGYAAGQTAHRSRSISHRGRWLSMAAMTMLTGLTGYQLGQRSLQGPVAEPALAASPDPAPIRPSSSLATSAVQSASHEDAERAAAVASDEAAQSGHARIWAGLFLNKPEQSVRATAFPMIGNDLEPEQVLERLSLVSTVSASGHHDDAVSAATDQPRRLMTASDTAAWMSSY